MARREGVRPLPLIVTIELPAGLEARRAEAAGADVVRRRRLEARRAEAAGAAVARRLEGLVPGLSGHARARLLLQRAGVLVVAHALHALLEGVAPLRPLEGLGGLELPDELFAGDHRVLDALPLPSLVTIELPAGLEASRAEATGADVVRRLEAQRAEAAGAAVARCLEHGFIFRRGLSSTGLISLDSNCSAYYLTFMHLSNAF